MTWDDFSNLSAAQKTKLQQFAAIGNALGGPRPNALPDISGVTYAQARAAEALMREINTLIGPAIVGIRHVQQKARDNALAIFEAGQ